MPRASRRSRSSSSVTRPRAPARAVASPHGLACRAHRGRRPARGAPPSARLGEPGRRRCAHRPGAGPGGATTSVQPAALGLGPPRTRPRSRRPHSATRTLVQFSTEFCSRLPVDRPAARRVAGDYDGVRHVEIDLTHRPDLADRFHVLQTPTTLILDARRRRSRPASAACPARTTVRDHLDTSPGGPMSRPEPAGIDPRGPRFTAAITAFLLLVIAVLGFGGAALAAWVLLAVAQRRLRVERDRRRAAQPVRPGVRSASCARGSRRPTELEDPRPPTFAQGVGFVVTIVGRRSSAPPGSPPPCRSRRRSRSSPPS